MLKKINEKRRLTICIVCLSLFIYTLSVVFSAQINALDSIIIYRNEFMSSVFKIITCFGDWYTIVIITLLSLFLKNKKYFKYITLNAIVITFTNQILKIIIHRPRPNINNRIINALGYSYPSGHAMISTAFYGFIFYLVWKSNLRMCYKIIINSLIVILIISICFSRVYLGVHYLTDVIAGSSLSMIYLCIYTYLLNKKKVWG